MSDKKKKLIETILLAVHELHEIETRKPAEEMTPEESLEEALLENEEQGLLALMKMPTHPTRH